MFRCAGDVFLSDVCVCTNVNTQKSDATFQTCFHDTAAEDSMLLSAKMLPLVP